MKKRAKGLMLLLILSGTLLPNAISAKDYSNTFAGTIGSSYGLVSSSAKGNGDKVANLTYDEGDNINVTFCVKRKESNGTTIQIGEATLYGYTESGGINLSEATSSASNYVLYAKRQGITFVKKEIGGTWEP